MTGAGDLEADEAVAAAQCERDAWTSIEAQQAIPMTGAGDHMALVFEPHNLAGTTFEDEDWPIGYISTSHSIPRPLLALHDVGISGKSIDELQAFAVHLVTAWNTRTESGVIGEMREALEAMFVREDSGIQVFMSGNPNVIAAFERRVRAILAKLDEVKL